MMSIRTWYSWSQRPQPGTCWDLFGTGSCTNILHTQRCGEHGTENKSWRIASNTCFCTESKSLPSPRQECMKFQLCCTLHINSSHHPSNLRKRRFLFVLLQELFSWLSSSCTSLNEAALGQQARGDWFSMMPVTGRPLAIRGIERAK